MLYKLLFSLVVFSIMFTADAQFRKIPSEVTDAFKTKYQNAAKVSWKDNIANFQASFKIGNDNARAYYSSKGEWLKTEINYGFNQLPAEVKDGFKKSKYTNWPIKEVLYTEEHDRQQPLYRIQVRKGDLQKKNLYFSPTGQLLDDAITL